MSHRMPTFEARCAKCDSVFAHPHLGDFAYGSFLFCAARGGRYALCDGFGTGGRRIQRLLPSDAPVRTLVGVLAALSDPLLGQQLLPGYVCPRCGSSSLQSWAGPRAGTTEVEQVTFNRILLLDEEQLAEEIRSILDEGVS